MVFDTSKGAAARMAFLLLSSLLAVTATVVSLSDKERDEFDEAIALFGIGITQVENKCSRSRRAGLAYRDTADNLFTGLSVGFQYRTLKVDP